MLKLTINQSDLIRALSFAVELSSNGISGHHLRTAFIANNIAECMSLSMEEKNKLKIAALLHDIGAASNKHEQESILERLHKVGEERNKALNAHAINGYEILKTCPIFEDIREIVLYHHSFYEEGCPDGVSQEVILLSRIVTIADVIEASIDPDKYILLQVEDVLEYLRKLSGTYLDPQLVRITHSLFKKESFLFDLINKRYLNKTFQTLSDGLNKEYSIEEVLLIAKMFSAIIDKTSNFTAVHSNSVSQTAKLLAYVKNWSEKDIKLMEIAGLFHDLGKLAIPNAILEKPGKLTKEEFLIIKQHTYFTYRILQEIDSFQTINEWASFHHETLDGKGYPFHIKGSSLSQGSRIMAISDIYVALTEKRPYRDPMPIPDVYKIMSSMADNEKIDKKLLKDFFREVVPILVK